LRYISRSCTASNDSYLHLLPAGQQVLWYIANVAISGARERVSWYTNLGYRGVGYLYVESVRFKKTNSYPYYTVNGQYKYSEANDTAVKTWHSYASNLYNFDRYAKVS